MAWQQASAAALGLPREGADVDRLIALFHIQRAIDAGDLTRVSVEQIREFRTNRPRLATVDAQQAYRRWTTSGEAGVRDWLQPAAVTALIITWNSRRTASRTTTAS